VILQIIFWATLVGQVVLLVLAIRLYRAKRTRAFALLMWACVCFVLARSSWLTFGFFTGFIFPHASRAIRTTASRWQDNTDVTFQFLSVILLIIALVFFFRERSSTATSSV
jgi:uncharacterized protein with PQ loop repeat